MPNCSLEMMFLHICMLASGVRREEVDPSAEVTSNQLLPVLLPLVRDGAAAQENAFVAKEASPGFAGILRNQVGGAAVTPPRKASKIDGREYPPALRIRGGRQVLVGGGTRAKFGAVKIYALGLYLPEATLDGLAKSGFAGKPAKDLGPSFFQGLAKPPATLLLQFHRSVSPDKVSDALKESLASRLDAKVLEKFHTALAGVLAESGVPKGLKLYFALDGKGVHIGAGSTAKMVSVPEPKIGRALLDVYYGKSPVSPQIKEGAAVGFEQMTAAF